MIDSLPIESDEKFACVVFSGFDLAFAGVPTLMRLGRGRWTSDTLPFSLDDWWRDQLGKIVVERLEEYSNFVLTSKASSPDEDERLLLNRVEWLLWGIAISAGIPTFELARAIFGRVGQGVPRIHVGSVPSLFRSHGLERPRAEPDDFMRAARFADRIEEMYRRKREHPRLYWRALSGFAAFRLAAQTPHGESRLHQFVRAIESFLPASVFGERKFVEYGKIFLSQHDESAELLAEMYRLRNKTEHHEHFEEARLSGSVPEETANRRTRQAEALCRELFRRLFTESAGFLDWYRDTAAIERFWEDPASVRDTWGNAFDLQSVA
ncbi:MAG: hypothetical protein ABSC63_13865 [Candidatus Binataceae bacterium]